MKKFLRKPLKSGFIVTAFLLLMNFSNIAFGASYTAVVSGNWSSSVTWGGAVPSLNNLADQITIPAGITVTMDNDLTLNGPTSQINVFGTLTASANNLMTILNGNISGSGIVYADEIVFGAASALYFTGSLTANAMTNSAATLQSSADIVINEALTLTTGAMSIQSGGSLSLSTNATIYRSGGSLVVNGGSISLSTPYNVVYIAGNSTAGVELNGSGLQNLTINPGTTMSVTLSNDLTVNGTLTMTSGSLVLAGNDLRIEGNVSATGSGNISTTNASNISIVTTNTVSGSLNFNSISHSVNNLTVSVGNSNQASISGTVNVDGTLTLTSGTLSLNGAYLNIMGDISAGGNGSISSNSNSSILINTSASPSGHLEFTAGGNTVDDFTVDISGGGSVMISSDMVVNGTLALTAGHINMGNNQLIIGTSGNISGGSSGSYVITGSAGVLTRTVSPLFATNYPVGTAGGYFPASVILNVGSNTGTVSVGVYGNVYSNGAPAGGFDLSSTEPLVDATWNLESSITSGLDMDLDLMWSSSSEVNGFDRTDSYISHYSNSQWDTGITSAAATVAGGMFSQTRLNITSLSPFAVFDGTTAGMTGLENTTFHIYPNPVSDELSLVDFGTQETVTVEILNVYGQSIASYTLTDLNSEIPVRDLPKGNYFIKLNSHSNQSVKRFTKI